MKKLIQKYQDGKPFPRIRAWLADRKVKKAAEPLKDKLESDESLKNFVEDYQQRHNQYEQNNQINITDDDLNSVGYVEGQIHNPYLKGAGGYYDSKNNLILNVSGKNDTNTHEISHWLYDKYGISNASKDKLRAAFPNNLLYWINSYKNPSQDLQDNERHSINAQLRNRISQWNGGVTGEELNEVIRNLDDGRLDQLFRGLPYINSSEYNKLWYTPEGGGLQKLDPKWKEALITSLIEVAQNTNQNTNQIVYAKRGNNLHNLIKRFK